MLILILGSLLLLIACFSIYGFGGGLFIFIALLFIGTILYKVYKGLSHHLSVRQKPAYKVNDATVTESIKINKVLDKKQPITDKEYRRISSVMANNIITHLTGVMGFLSMLDSESFGKLSPDQKKPIDTLLTESQRLIIYVKGLKELGNLR